MFSTRNLSKENTMCAYFKDANRSILCSESNYYDNGRLLSVQEIFIRQHWNRLFIGKNVTDSIDKRFYKHQELASRSLFTNDSMIIVHEPGTGKTITQLKTMMDLLVAKAITSFVIINLSETGNSVAINTLRDLYDSYYFKYFKPDTFEKFKNQHIKHVTTNTIISRGNYQPNIGIVCDEAHNLLSDSETRKTKKPALVKDFIENIAGKKGIKLLFSTATPLFGDSKSISKFRSLMFRSMHETDNEIPGSLVSYIKINYDHLKIIFAQNKKYPEHGDYSFEMKNKKIYPFKFYVTKPSPMQLADFFNLNFIENEKKTIGKDKFQTYDKPLIVQSNPHVDVKTGKLTRQSAIIDEIVERIKETNDGTIIIYTDISEKGAKEIGRLLSERGFEKYSEKGSNKEATHVLTTEDTNNIGKLTQEIWKLSDEILDLKEKISSKTEKDLELLRKNYETAKLLQLDQIIINSMKSYINFFKSDFEKDKLARVRITEIELEITKLKEDVLAIKRGQKKRPDQHKVYKYIIYTSGMTADEKAAFQKFSKPENKEGEIKVAIISRIGRDAVDIKHAIQTHIVIPDWRIPGLIQAQHRGIRNNGHRELAKHRAAILKKYLEEEGKFIGIGDAIDQIERERINVEIYLHLMDFDLIEDEDIIEARPYMIGDAKNASVEEIKEILFDEKGEHLAGKKIIRAAMEHHYDVGPAFMDLVSSSFDFFTNVKKNDRIEFAIDKNEEDYYANDFANQLIGEADTELFHVDDYLIDLVKDIKNILYKQGMINTDELYDHFLNSGKNLTVNIITEAIMKLLNGCYVYNPNLGINMIVKLWEKEEHGFSESILYLDTTFSKKTHPSISYINSSPFSFCLVDEREKTKIHKEDLTFPKSSNALNKLKDLLERAIDSNYSLGIREVEFLIQLKNYWSFSWNELKNRQNKNSRNINVYVFQTHIHSPDINVLAKDLKIEEYNIVSKEWKTLKTSNLKNMFYVRGASLIDLYRNFNFSKFEEFADFYANSSIETNDPISVNGIVFIKGFYNPNFSYSHMVDKLLQQPSVLEEPIGKNVLVKNFGIPHSRGSQIARNTKKDLTKSKVIEIIKDIKDISMFFFLYDKNTFPAGIKPNIFKIKLEEMEEMSKAMNGYPTLRYQIPIIEERITSFERKREMYREIFNFGFNE